MIKNKMLRVKTFKVGAWVWWCRVDSRGHTIHAWWVEGLEGSDTPETVEQWIMNKT